MEGDGGGSWQLKQQGERKKRAIKAKKKKRKHEVKTIGYKKREASACTSASILKWERIAWGTDDSEF